MRWCPAQRRYRKALDIFWNSKCFSAVSDTAQCSNNDHSHTHSDNTSEAYEAASLTPAPGVWMAIYDPQYDIEQMIPDGQLYTAQIDANSHTVVNVGLVRYRYLNRTSNYKYRM
jgi:hypothetical protein